MSTSIEPSTTTGNSQAEELGLTGIPAEDLVHVISVGFTERFMGGTRIRGKDGYRWRNKATGVAEKQPFDVSGNDGKVLEGLRQFCRQNGLVWSMEENADGVALRIGRLVGTVPGEAAQLAAACTPVMGVTIALCMLHIAGFNFKEAHSELFENAPRLQLVD